MNFIIVFSVLISVAVLLYLVFLGIGFAGVSKNRKAQGLDK